MNRKIKLAAVGLLLGSMLCLGAGPAKCPDEQGVKELVGEAVKHIQAKGEAAFAEMNQRPSRWSQGDRYIFVCDEKGTELVNSAFPELVGQNLWDLKDEAGKYLVRDEVELAKARSGWVESTWPKPGQSAPVKVRSYVSGVKLNGKFLVVGAPCYLE
ncbi:MAG: cache domain-containing protein [Deltaproteobacteria bacterium]|nr:cache domain-containing protein [Deltaproteobacteria bacterium]